MPKDTTKNQLSITVSPDRESPEMLPSLDDFADWLSKSELVGNYYVAFEHGKSDVPTHFQCVISTSSKSSYFREKIYAFCHVDRKEYPYFVKSKDIVKDNYLYCLGYCQKEEVEYRTNLSDDLLQQGVEFYGKMSHAEVKTNKSKLLTINRILKALVDCHKHNSQVSYNQYVFDRFLHYNREVIPPVVLMKLIKMNRSRDDEMKELVNLFLRPAFTTEELPSEFEGQFLDSSV